MQRPAPSTFARASDQMIVYVTPKSALTIEGPGSMPIRTIPPRKTAIEPEPGMPNISVGRSPPPSFALFALSGAMTPRTSPLPKRSVFFSDCIA